MSRWNVVAERNREQVRKNAVAILNDTHYDRLRAPTPLRLLVVAYVAVTVALAVSWVLVGAWAGILGNLVWIVVFLLLRVAVRSQADLPDDVLDERMVAERNSVYVEAYRASSGVLFLGACALFAMVAFDATDPTLTLDYDDLSAIMWVVFSVVMGAPSVFMALRSAAGITTAHER